MAHMVVFSWHLLVGSGEADERLQLRSSTSADEDSNRGPEHVSAA